MKPRKTSLECPRCKTPGEKQMHKRICISQHADLKDSILNGSYFEWECPRCNERFFIEDVFLYNDDLNKFMVYLVSGYDKRIQKVPTVLKTLDEYDTDTSTLRITPSFTDFVEKIRILEAGLDDRVIETMKTVYSQVYYQTQGETVYNIIFEKINDDNALSFAVFLKENDFHIHIPYDAYTQAQSDFKQLFAEHSKDEFIMIDQSWLTQTLKNNNLVN